jgi:N-acetylglucosaminyldiphosphoundecaprenol N-acetyl-beta-D-mannosaminyltransferase
MIKVLNIPLYDDTLSSAVSCVIKTCSEQKEKMNRCVSARDAHGLVFAQKNKGFDNILKNFYWNLPDGMPSVWVGRLKGAKTMERCYGPDFFKDVMIASAGKPMRHYLCGGKEGVAEELKLACETRFKNFNVVGTYCPPFRTMTDDELRTLTNDINYKNIDVVWIGMSTPKQELFAAQLAKHTEVHFLVTVGAAFDFHTGKVPQAPKIIQKMGLEWFFRLCMEPKRLFNRYAVTVPLFIYYNIKECISYFFQGYKA